MTTDLLIARAARLRPIAEIAAAAGIREAFLEPYGRFKGKVSEAILPTLPEREGVLVLVSGISPTPAGEGKTTTTIGLADALAAGGTRGGGGRRWRRWRISTCISPGISTRSRPPTTC